MKVKLGVFTVKSVESRLGGDLGAGVKMAARHYGKRLQTGRPPVPPPPPPELGGDRDPPVIEVDVDLDPSSAQQLEAEARRTGTDLQLLVAHAVLVYLADLDRERGDCGGRGRSRPPLRQL